jgi:hypothetical protein
MTNLLSGLRTAAGMLVELLARCVAFDCNLDDVALDDQELAEQLHVGAE